jgi:hypothetical protein
MRRVLVLGALLLLAGCGGSEHALVGSWRSVWLGAGDDGQATGRVIRTATVRFDRDRTFEACYAGNGQIRAVVGTWEEGPAEKTQAASFRAVVGMIDGKPVLEAPAPSAVPFHIDDEGRLWFPSEVDVERGALDVRLPLLPLWPDSVSVARPFPGLDVIGLGVMYLLIGTARWSSPSRRRRVALSRWVPLGMVWIAAGLLIFTWQLPAPATPGHDSFQRVWTSCLFGLCILMGLVSALQNARRDYRRFRERWRREWGSPAAKPPAAKGVGAPPAE